MVPDIKAEIVTMGELLVDFIPHQKDCQLKDVKKFSRAAGGAPANVAAALAKINISSGFIGMVGADSFGDFLIETMKGRGVDTTNIIRTTEAMTTLAFVSLTASGDRDFAFYRKPGADMLLKKDDINLESFVDSKIFYFGTISLSKNPCRETTYYLLEQACKNDIFVTFDPNIRLPLWDNDQTALREHFFKSLPYADLLKMNLDELQLLTNFTSSKNLSDLFEKPQASDSDLFEKPQASDSDLFEKSTASTDSHPCSQAIARAEICSPSQSPSQPTQPTQTKQPPQPSQTKHSKQGEQPEQESQPDQSSQPKKASQRDQSSQPDQASQSKQITESGQNAGKSAVRLNPVLESLIEAADNLLASGPEHLIITDGSNGSCLINNREIIYSPALEVEARDTTGAGDAFMAGILSQILNHVRTDHLNTIDWQEVLSRANIFGALASKKYGAIPSFPTEKEVTQAAKSHFNSL